MYSDKTLWISTIWFSAIERSSRCFERLFSSLFTLILRSSFSLPNSTSSSFNESISAVLTFSSSWAICSPFETFWRRSLRFEIIFCWVIISSWSCWWPPRSFSHSPSALVRFRLSSVDFSSKWAFADFISSMWLFFCSFSLVKALSWIFCSTHCLLSFRISFRFNSPRFVASCNWACKAMLSLCSFSHLSSKSDNVLFTSKTSSRKFRLSLSHRSCATLRSSRSRWDFEFSNWESRQSWRDILRSCSSFVILALLFSISFSRMACRSLLFFNNRSKCCCWEVSSCPLSLWSRSFKRASTVASYWLSLSFSDEISFWAFFNLDSLDSW